MSQKQDQRFFLQISKTKICSTKLILVFRTCLVAITAWSRPEYDVRSFAHLNLGIFLYIHYSRPSNLCSSVSEFTVTLCGLNREKNEGEFFIF